MSEIKEKIKALKKEKQAVILAHNYQLGEVQDIADYVGDSLELAQQATKITADVILFCGVYFMAEMVKILSPQKKVVMPDKKAGCPMANMVTVEELLKAKKNHPEALVVCYVNSPAEVKALVDVCCTSMNAEKIIRAYPDKKEILFIPDQFLGHFTSKKFSERNFILWNGYCHVHMNILPEHIKELKDKHPKALVMVHPECTPAITDLADHVLGTGGMLRLVKESQAQEFIVGTENGMCYRLAKENPEKIFYPASQTALCPNMKLSTLEKVLFALEDLKEEIQVEDEIAKKAKVSIDRMLELSKD